LDSLDVDALVEILTQPKNALIRQYKKLFEMEEANLDFTDEALEILAQKALERNTGARALRAITEELMIELMYRLPEETKGSTYVITKEVIEGDVDVFKTAKRSKKESA
jgi:ATP-dependent Clp protease ATP-binding subunit ClpX